LGNGCIDDGAPTVLGKKVGSTLTLIPAFSPGEKVKRSLRLAAKLRLDWFKRWQQLATCEAMSSPWGE
jgi:hypothetical protein